MAETTPSWAVVPFAAYLLLLALLPLFLGRFWEHNRNKLLVALLASAPIAYYLVAYRPGGGALLMQTACDYASFLALLGALFTISGGIYLRGSLVGTPFVNLAFLGAGSILASLIGTTGASVLLIRPLLRANQRRPFATHVVVFFIFIVSNGAGLLTPLGDPPLFLGFLRGVPFAWTFRLVEPWALVNGTLLTLFALVDTYFHLRAERESENRVKFPAPAPVERLRLEGGINLIWLVGIIVVVFSLGTFGPRLFTTDYGRTAAQVVGTLFFAGLSLLTTARSVHEANHFSWAPIVEVAVVFLGVFVTMVPALSFLEERGASLGITQPWQFFWASGALSSVLDNAPTYLTFASLARGVIESNGAHLGAGGLGALARHPTGQHLLAAISCGAVFMGAMTYIGNGPNFMVKAIAEQHHVRMPSFFAYVLWSGTILLPIFAIVSKVFF